jgi:hypothetical protein
MGDQVCLGPFFSESFFAHKREMIDKFVLSLVIIALLYLGVILVKSYQPRWFDGFSTQKKAAPLAAAPPVFVPPPPPPQVVAPAGPAAPAAEAPPLPPAPTRVPAEKANDPYDEVQGKIPIEDNLRHPENSFGPGLQNRGTFLSEASGVASKNGDGAAVTFSPDFAQNGGEFMNGIFANTLGGDEYSLV